MTQFRQKVLAVVALIPTGEVMTYGEVAAEIGVPGAARAVGSVLRDHGHDVPWWRVVTSSGRLVPHGQDLHAERLIAEGVRIVNGKVEMGR